MPLILVSPYRKIVQAIIDAYKGAGASVVLLMHCDGTNGSALFIDETGKTITRGGAPSLSGVQAKFGSTSIGFGEGQSSNNRIVLPQSTDFAFGVNDFCIEMHVYLTQRSTQWGTFLYEGRTSGGAQNGGNNAPVIAVNPNGTLLAGLAGTNKFITTTDVVPLNTWSHVALMRINGVVFAAIDGKVSAGIADSSSAVCDATPLIGCAANFASSTTVCGYIDEIRITKGYGRYAQTFTPPTQAFPNPTDKYFNYVSLLMDMEVLAGDTPDKFRNLIGGALLSNVGAPVQTTALKKFGETSAYLDGDSYLTAPLSVGQFAGDFTIECFVNQTGLNRRYNTIFANYSVWGGGSLSLFAGHQDSTNRFTVGINGSFPAMRSTTALKFGEWVHLCIERTGSTLRLYVNGVIETSATSSAALNGSGTNFFIGTAGNSLTESMFKGHIEEFRITKAARYKGVNFSIPAEAYPKNGL